MSTFVSGAEMSRLLYHELVRPALETSFPGLPHSAALLGRGSEVLGFDDAMSTDHADMAGNSPAGQPANQSETRLPLYAPTATSGRCTCDSGRLRTSGLPQLSPILAV